MTKISNYALTAALLTHGVPRSAGQACDGIISTFDGECTYQNFINNLSQGCNVDELFPSDGTDESSPFNQVQMLCRYHAPVQFGEIQGTYQRDRRYFAGSGSLVDAEHFSIESARLQRFEANIGSETIIAFPEYTARFQHNVDNGNGANGYPANMNLYAECELNTVMCCFTDGSNGDGFAAYGDATTDVCRHDLSDSPQSGHIKEGWGVFPGAETATHCVGFTWNDGEEELLGNMMYDISLRNTANKGYLRGVPGSPMCGCIEHMPVVEAAACRTATKTGAIVYTFSYSPEEGYVTASNSADIDYADCNEPDLKAQYVANQAGDADREALIGEHLVGPGGCEDDLVEYLNEEQLLHVGQHPTKYVTPDDKWSDLVVGEGIYFLPPIINPIESDAHFRGLIEAGCADVAEDGTATPRYCIIRRVCSSCQSEAHRDIYYKRLTDLPPPGTNSTNGEVYFLEVFMNNWNKYKNDMAAGDFELYSTYQDAVHGTNAWEYCTYGTEGVYGFPRNCGPKSNAHEWNSYVRGGGNAIHHGFYVEKPQTA